MWRYLRDPTFSRFDTIPECDRHTHTDTHTERDRQTDRHTTTAYTALSKASCGKNCSFSKSVFGLIVVLQPFQFHFGFSLYFSIIKRWSFYVSAFSMYWDCMTVQTAEAVPHLLLARSWRRNIFLVHKVVSNLSVLYIRSRAPRHLMIAHCARWHLGFDTAAPVQLLP